MLEKFVKSWKLTVDNINLARIILYQSIALEELYNLSFDCKKIEWISWSKIKLN